MVSPRVAHVFHHRAKPSGLSVFAGLKEHTNVRLVRRAFCSLCVDSLHCTPVAHKSKLYTRLSETIRHKYHLINRFRTVLQNIRFANEDLYPIA